MGEGCLPIPQEMGGLPEKVVYWSLSVSLSRSKSKKLLFPVFIPETSNELSVEENREQSMREAYRDLAHIIHHRFCYNRPNRG